jgi:hypothetical protein
VSEGYTLGLKFLVANRPIFMGVIMKRPIFCAEYTYALDTVFQSFLYRLGRFYKDPVPIRSAQRDGMKDFQQREVEQAMHGFEFGATPLLRLPAALTLSPAPSVQIKPITEGRGQIGGGQTQTRKQSGYSPKKRSTRTILTQELSQTNRT